MKTQTSFSSPGNDSRETPKSLARISSPGDADALPLDKDILRLKQELNFLLWTADVPPIPEGFQSLVATARVPEQTKINMQCIAHTLVASEVFMRRGFRVTIRAGRAFVLEPSQDNNPQNDYLNDIGKHWWLSLDGHGLVDLSLPGESQNPLIYCNRSVGGDWEVIFGEGTEKLAPFLKARRRGCFYITLAKCPVSNRESDVMQDFPPARVQGIGLSYGKIAEHCEHLLKGTAESLTCLTQTDAWRRLRESYLD